MRRVKANIYFPQSRAAAYQQACKTAAEFPGYRALEGGHSVVISAPLGNRPAWKKFLGLAWLVHKWAGVVVEFNGIQPQNIGHKIAEVRAILDCSENRALSAQGDDWCCGRQAPARDPLCFGCRYLSGPVLSFYPGGPPAWWEYGKLSSDLKVFTVDLNGLVDRLYAANEGQDCVCCPHFSWERIKLIIAELPREIDLTLDQRWCLRFSGLQPDRAIGIQPKVRAIPGSATGVILGVVEPPED